jgi:hypothetical protein
MKINLKERGFEDVDWIQCGSTTAQRPALMNSSYERSDPIKGGNIFTYLIEYYLLKKDSAQWS